MNQHQRVDQTCAYPPCGIPFRARATDVRNVRKLGGADVTVPAPAPSGTSGGKKRRRPVTPAEFWAVIYWAGFLLSLGWALAASDLDPDISQEPEWMKFVANILFAFAWPAALLVDCFHGTKEDTENDQNP